MIAAIAVFSVTCLAIATMILSAYLTEAGFFRWVIWRSIERRLGLL